MRVLIILAIAMLLAACSPDPTVVVRIDCGEHNNQELQVELNGKPSGTCPMDMMIHAGDLTVTARKDNEDASYLYGEAKMTLPENAMKRIKLDIQPTYTEKYYFNRSDTIEGVYEYLDRFPQSIHESEMHSRLDELLPRKLIRFCTPLKEYFCGIFDIKRNDFILINNETFKITAGYDTSISKSKTVSVEDVRTGNEGHVDLSGRFLYPPKKGAIGDFSSDYAVYIKESKGMGSNSVCIDKKGNEVTKSQKWSYYFCGFDRKWVLAKEKFGLYWVAHVDLQGNRLLEFDYEDGHNFREGLAFFKRNGKWGVVNDKGDILIQPTYDEVDGFYQNGLAAVNKNGFWGLVDSAGLWIVEPRYNHLSGLVKHSFFEYKKGDEIGIFDAALKKETPANFDRINSKIGVYGVAVAYKDERAGLIDEFGNFIVEPVYDRLGADNVDYGVFCGERKDNLDLCIDYKGNMLLEVKEICGEKHIVNSLGNVIYPSSTKSCK